MAYQKHGALAHATIMCCMDGTLICFVWLHSVCLLRSSWGAQFLCQSTALLTMVSSANNLILDLMSVPVSFMNSKTWCDCKLILVAPQRWLPRGDWNIVRGGSLNNYSLEWPLKNSLMPYHSTFHTYTSELLSRCPLDRFPTRMMHHPLHSGLQVSSVSWTCDKS